MLRVLFVPKEEVTFGARANQIFADNDSTYYAIIKINFSLIARTFLVSQQKPTRRKTSNGLGGDSRVRLLLFSLQNEQAIKSLPISFASHVLMPRVN